MNPSLKKLIRLKAKSKNYGTILAILKELENLKIKYQLVYQQGHDFYFRLKHKQKVFYLLNNTLQYNLDKYSSLLVSNKEFTRRVLRQNAIAAPLGTVVDNFAQAQKFLKSKKLKFPVVVKPNTLSLGRGVYANLHNFSEVRQALAKIKHHPDFKPGEKIILEEYFFGRDYRFLVLDGKFLAASERVHPQIIGDNRQTVKQLINQQLKVGGPESLLFDWEVERNLKKNKVNFKSILPAGQTIRLRENANMCTGGICINRTGEVADKFKKVAEKCARIFKIRLAGVDIMSPEINNPRVDYRVVEVNCFPGFYTTHDAPDIGRSERVTAKIIKALFNL